MTTLLLDTHALLWLDAEPERLSTRASEAIDAADELAVASITWFELAWLGEHGRIVTAIPLRTWLPRLASGVRSIPVTPAIAATAVALGPEFPADPADRLIYATAVEHGLRVVTKDERLHQHPHPRAEAIW